MSNLKSALKQDTYAVVGASQNKTKYGYKVFKFLKEKGLTVYPVNPSVKEVAGVKCYPKLASISEEIDVVVSIVPPQISKKIAREVAELDISYFWMQPGAEFESAKEFCEKLGLKSIIDECIMVEMNK
ncbi:CoA-binding protein [Halanaerocella petrolearia]